MPWAFPTSNATTLGHASQCFASGDFGVKIHSRHVRKVSKNGYNYIALEHNAEYSLTLFNESSSRCDAEVSIDGRSIGTFRVKPYNSVHIERPATRHQKFVFLQEDTGIAYRAGISNGKSTNGLVSVKFSPEYPRHDMSKSVWAPASRQCRMSFGLESGSLTNSTNQMYSCDSNGFKEFNTLSSGATALGDHSSQTFESVSPLREIDHSRKATITFRLIAEDTDWGMIKPREHDDWPTIARVDLESRHEFYPPRYHDYFDEHDDSIFHHCRCREHDRTPPRINMRGIEYSFLNPSHHYYFDDRIRHEACAEL
jgi:hypothetical protein